MNTKQGFYFANSFDKSFYKLGFIILLNLITSTITLGQEQGNFRIQNYRPTDYNAFVQNWSSIQDNKGNMYFANGEGVLKYDGVEWQVIKASNNSIIRSLAKDQSGVIYVGATGDFGYLQQGEKGKVCFISLTNKLKAEDKDFLEVWYTRTIGNDVYFCTYKTLFRFRNGQIKVWRAKNDIYSCFVSKNQIYLYVNNIGIKKVDNDTLALIPNGDFFKDKPFRMAIPYEDNKVLIAPAGNGFYLFDFDTINSKNREKSIVRFKTEVDSICNLSYPYSGIQLKDGRFALCLVPFGVAIIDRNGKLVHFLNKNSGLQNESVANVYEDNESNLWMALSKGISKVDINAPLTSWSNVGGFELINDLARFNQSIYLACLNGLFKLKGNKIVRVDNLELPIFSLLNFKLPNDTSKHILLGGTEFNGIIEIKDDKVLPILYCKSITYLLYQSKLDPSYLYIGQSGSLEIAHYENGTLKHVGFVQGINNEVRSILEESDGTIWCSNQTNLTICIKPSGNLLKPKQIIYYKKEEGINGYHYLFSYKDKVFITTETGFRSLNEAKTQFVPDTLFGKEYCNGSVTNTGFYQDEKTGAVWILGQKNNHLGIGLKNENGKYDWFDAVFNFLPENSAPLVYFEADSTIWISTHEELYRHKGSLVRPRPPYQTIIKKVSIGKDSILYFDGDTLLPKKSKNSKPLIPHLAYKHNSIAFSFTALTYYNENATFFQTYLEGFDNDWSGWTKDPEKEYTNLSEGSYKLHVRAKNFYNVIGREAIYEFVIMPPWYRSILALLLYFIVFAGILIIIVEMYTKRLKTANARLERIVNQRTIEIKKQRDELLMLNSTKDKFFGIIAHDLRNPFNSILGFSELIIDKLKKQDFKTSLFFMETLRKTSISAYELLDNLLTWSRSQSGVIPFNPEVLDINKQINHSVAMLEGSAQIKGIKLGSSISANLFVYADKNMLLTILRNLLTNAIKFSQEGDSVTVSSKASGNYIIVSVSDTGIGIAANVISKLFKVDEDIKTEGTANEPGTGLGLILCKEFVEKNNGKIWVESTLEKGSCFSFTLPIAEG